MKSLLHFLALPWLVSAAAVSLAAPSPGLGKIELLRDSWGIPHVFSDTDAGAMYGLGYATAQERGFQMTYSLRMIQGRLAEVVGDRPKTSGRETALDHDRKMRTFGWARAAARTAASRSPRPDSPYRTSTMALWGQAQMHPAPLSRKAVEKLGVERLKLAP
jgi:acyl-homoserine lactone acylase PvdQ